MHTYTPMQSLRHILLLTLSVMFSLCQAQPLVPQSGHEALNVCILGDSNAWLSGDDCADERGWPYWFVRKFAPASCRSYARSGATWTHTAQTRKNLVEVSGRLGNDNVIYNQVERLIAAVRAGQQPAPHLVVICCGTNDAWFEKARPAACEKSAAEAFAQRGGYITQRAVSSLTSLADCVRFDCELLWQHLPDAQILLVTPPQTTNPGAARIRRVSDLLADCAAYLGVGCIRLDTAGCIYEARERAQNHFTYDGTHTSVAGAHRNGCFIANQAAALLHY